MRSQSISLLINIPEDLYLSLQNYLETHSLWSQDRVAQAALSLFLMQNGMDEHSIKTIYLDTVFGCAA
jgi:hypothetical protein